MHELEQLLKRLMEFGLLTNEEEQLVKKSMLAIEIQIYPKTNYIEFIDQFNLITKKKYKPDTDSREIFYENIHVHSLSDRISALKNAVTDPWVKESNSVLSPKWILKPDIVAKYLNYVAPAKKPEINKDLSKNDYGTIVV